jgi:hypothetical protein
MSKNAVRITCLAVAAVMIITFVVDAVVSFI